MSTRVRSLALLWALFIAAPASAQVTTDGLADPPIRPGFSRPDLIARHTDAERQAVAAAALSGTLSTLPYWRRAFTVGGKTYHYSMLGADPATSIAATTIPVVIVPMKLTVTDFLVNGQPIVFDATPIVSHVLGSPIFARSTYGDGYRQFMDAMLRMEFPTANSGWKTLLSTTVAPTIEITTTTANVRVKKTKSGQYLALITNDSIFDNQFATYVKGAGNDPSKLVMFISYNSMEHDAFGYHDAFILQNGTQERVYGYNSWLEGVDSFFSVPSPDAATLAHEIAETVHDPFLGSLSSVTLLWGDPFGANACFQKYIEVGDAIEDAPANVQLYKQTVTQGGVSKDYTLQNEALLQWFTRTTPSDAMNGAYSFPSLTALTSAAPMTCN